MGDEGKGIDGDDTENKSSEEKKGFEIRSKVVKILANFKPKEKKMTEEVVAPEFEKVELTNVEDNKDCENEISETQGFGSKLASFMSKFRPTGKPADQETAKAEKEAEAESDDQDKEVDLNPEKPEEQVLNRRRGSETPV